MYHSLQNFIEQEEIYSPSQILKIIYEKLYNSQDLKNIWVEGEIYNLRFAYDKHIYFYLKDSDSTIQCTLFNIQNRTNIQIEELKDGKKIKVQGSITLYKKNGICQINVNKIENLGKGEIYEILRDRFKKLNEENLFDQSRKRKLPKLPINLGVVTSESGAVLKDIVKIARKRFPNINIILSPTLTQGKEAKEQIIKAIQILNELDDPKYKIDVIIVARGGGSFDELLVFSEEDVVRAFANSRLPIVSAIGHQIDHPLCEYAADYAAATPSEASEKCVPEIEFFYDRLNQFQKRMYHAVLKKIEKYKQNLEYISKKSIFLNPLEILEEYYQRMDEVNSRLNEKIKYKIEKKKNEFNLLKERILHLDPYLPLKKGYFYIKKENRIIKDLNLLDKDDKIEIYSVYNKAEAIIKKISNYKSMDK